MAITTDLPSGVITCVFSDIEGSTQMLRELGPDFEPCCAGTTSSCAAWEAHEGHEVRTIGDAFFVVFGDSGRAVAAAVAAQRALAADGWPGRVRIGMHTGYARPTEGDYTALVVNQAARIVGAARAVRSADPGDRRGPRSAVVHPLGLFRVRDFESPIELFAAIGEHVPEIDAPPRVPPAEHHNLTRPTTSIIGRDEDVARVAERIEARTLTTLIGPGGVGKTRLAIEAALGVADEWEDGAWFIDLAPLEDGALIAEAMGAAVAPRLSRRRSGGPRCCPTSSNATRCS